MASIMAARSGAHVTLLEQNDRNGRKLNATGNGRCNFTNALWPDDALRGTHPEFAQNALSRFSVKDTLAFFEELGICPVEKNGYYYPRSGQAQAVT
jgi:predicted flavoprotein YhiN